MRKLLLTWIVCTVAMASLSARRATAPGPDPTMVLQTVKGTIEIRLFQSESPKSVGHILDLVKTNFYRGLRIHRAERTLVQFGDPTTRDVSRRAWWGRTGSGKPIGVAEFNKHRNVRGAVGLAHSGDPRYADSQLYILKAASPSLNGKHVVVGQVTKGMDVVDRLKVADIIKVVTIKGAGQS